MDEDKRVVRQVLGGDIDVFDILVRKYSQPVFETVARRVPFNDVESVCQEVFIAAFQSLHTYGKCKPFEHWVRRIARRRCCDYWRSKHSKKQQLHETYDHVEDHWFETQCAHSAREVYRTNLEREATAEMLQRALSELNAAERAVVECVYFEGLSLKEVGATFGWSLANVKVRAYRARKKLRVIIEEQFNKSECK